MNEQNEFTPVPETQTGKTEKKKHVGLIVAVSVLTALLIAGSAGAFFLLRAPDMDRVLRKTGEQLFPEWFALAARLREHTPGEGELPEMQADVHLPPELLGTKEWLDLTLGLLGGKTAGEAKLTARAGEQPELTVNAAYDRETCSVTVGADEENGADAYGVRYDGMTRALEGSVFNPANGKDEALDEETYRILRALLENAEQEAARIKNVEADETEAQDPELRAALRELNEKLNGIIVPQYSAAFENGFFPVKTVTVSFDTEDIVASVNALRQTLADHPSLVSLLDPSAEAAEDSAPEEDVTPDERLAQIAEKLAKFEIEVIWTLRSQRDLLLDARLDLSMSGENVNSTAAVEFIPAYGEEHGISVKLIAKDLPVQELISPKPLTLSEEEETDDVQEAAPFSAAVTLSYTAGPDGDDRRYRLSLTTEEATGPQDTEAPLKTELRADLSYRESDGGYALSLSGLTDGETEFTLHASGSFTVSADETVLSLSELTYPVSAARYEYGKGFTVNETEQTLKDLLTLKYLRSASVPEIPADFKEILSLSSRELEEFAGENGPLGQILTFAAGALTPADTDSLFTVDGTELYPAAKYNELGMKYFRLFNEALQYDARQFAQEEIFSENGLYAYAYHVIVRDDEQDLWLLLDYDGTVNQIYVNYTAVLTPELEAAYHPGTLNGSTLTVHEYQSETAPSSCTEDGYTTVTCARCGFAYKKDLMRKGHVYDAPLTRRTVKNEENLDSEMLYALCSRCGKAPVILHPSAGYTYELEERDGAVILARASAEVPTSCFVPASFPVPGVGTGNSLLLTEIGPDAFDGVSPYFVADCVRLENGITTLNDRCLAGLQSRRVVIPASVTKIGAEVFNGYLETVLYLGTEEQWMKIDVAPENKTLHSVPIYCNYDGAPINATPGFDYYLSQLAWETMHGSPADMVKADPKAFTVLLTMGGADSAAADPETGYIAAASGNKVTVYDNTLKKKYTVTVPYEPGSLSQYSSPRLSVALGSGVLAVSGPNGKYLVSLWDEKTGAFLKNVEVTPKNFHNISSRDHTCELIIGGGQLMFASADQHCYLWFYDLASGEISEYGSTLYAPALAYDPQAGILAALEHECSPCSIYFIDAVTHKQISKCWDIGPSRAVTAVEGGFIVKQGDLLTTADRNDPFYPSGLIRSGAEAQAQTMGDSRTRVFLSGSGYSAVESMDALNRPGLVLTDDAKGTLTVRAIPEQVYYLGNGRFLLFYPDDKTAVAATVKK